MLQLNFRCWNICRKNLLDLRMHHGLSYLQVYSVYECVWLRVCLTWPINEITVTQPSDFHPLKEKHCGSDV